MSESPSSESIYSDHLWGRRFGTVYRVRVSILYHLKRARFFDRCDKWISILVAVAATAAVGVVLKKGGGAAEVWAASVTAVLSLIPVVVNPAEKARNHTNAAAEFRRLLAECERAGERWSEHQCDQFAGRVVELEATEPAPLCALVIDCQNQLHVAAGQDDKRVKLRLYERWLKQWIDFDAGSIMERHERQIRLASGTR